jgi:hypothetical protein
MKRKIFVVDVIKNAMDQECTCISLIVPLFFTVVIVLDDMRNRYFYAWTWILVCTRCLN